VKEKSMTTFKMASANPFPAQPTTNWQPRAPGSNGTLIAVVLDESGSMGVVRDATIAGLNEFVAAQRATEGAGAAYLTLVKFDAPKITPLLENVSLASVPHFTHAHYTPNGGTNLMDAIGYTLNRVNHVLGSVPAEERPGVLVVIITDGHENSSREYNTSQIREMVKSAESQEWVFSFLGANVDAFSMGQAFGMQQSNTVTYSTASMGDTMEVLSKMTTTVRMAKSAGMSTSDLYASNRMYDLDDRARAMGKKDA